jgi:hypothetical protein
MYRHMWFAFLPASFRCLTIVSHVWPYSALAHTYPACMRNSICACAQGLLLQKQCSERNSLTTTMASLHCITSTLLCTHRPAVHTPATARRSTAPTPDILCLWPAAAFCRQSAYKLPCKTVIANKKAMFATCKLAVTIGKAVQRKNGCCTFPQKVKDEVRTPRPQ